MSNERPSLANYTDDELLTAENTVRAEQERRLILRDTPEQILYGVERFLAAGGSLDDLALVRPEPTPESE